MKLSQFDFNLPKSKIALNPPRWRDECKLMVLHKDSGEIEHRQFKDIIDYFGKGDTFVLNDTKVFPPQHRPQTTNIRQHNTSETKRFTKKTPIIQKTHSASPK